MNQKQAEGRVVSSSPVQNRRAATEAAARDSAADEEEEKVEDGNEEKVGHLHMERSRVGHSAVAAFIGERAHLSTELSAAVHREYFRAMSSTKAKVLWQGAVKKVHSQICQKPASSKPYAKYRKQPLATAVINFFNYLNLFKFNFCRNE